MENFNKHIEGTFDTEKINNVMRTEYHIIQDGDIFHFIELEGLDIADIDFLYEKVKKDLFEMKNNEGYVDGGNLSDYYHEIGEKYFSKNEEFVSVLEDVVFG